MMTGTGKMRKGIARVLTDGIGLATVLCFMMERGCLRLYNPLTLSEQTHDELEITSYITDLWNCEVFA